METYAKGRVYKRGRIWFLDYALDAKRIRESAETTNKAVAERLLASKLAAIDEGSYTHIKKSKLGFRSRAEFAIEAIREKMKK